MTLDLFDIITNLNELGIREVFLPFVLIFTVLFTLLDKTAIFIRASVDDPEETKKRKKSENRKFSAIIALSLSLTAVFMHVRGTLIAGIDIINFINSAVPSITALIVAVFGIFIVLALVMPSIFPDTGRLDMPISVIVIIAAIAIYLFVASTGWKASPANIPFVGTWLEDDTFRSMAIALLVFGGIVLYIIRGKEPKDNTKPNLWVDIWSALTKKP
jgi:cation transport ATPase